MDQQSTERISLAEIERLFPDEWVLILEPEIGPDTIVRSGIVAIHCPDRDELFEKAEKIQAEHCAIYFIGDPIPAGNLALL